MPKQIISRLFAAALITALAACTPGGREPAVSITPTPTVEIFPEAQQYADAHGITPEEAARRLDWQGAIGELNAALQANEAGTFGGLWIEHDPYKIVVVFTENGEETLRPYLANQPFADYVEVRTQPNTQAALEAVQQQAWAVVEQLEPLSIAGHIDVKNNRVVLTVGNPDLFLQEIAAAGLALPPQVVVEAIDPDNLPPGNRGGVTEYAAPDGSVIYFPQQGPFLGGMQALAEGTLWLDDNGCLRLGDLSPDAPLIIWRDDHTLHVDGEAITVQNDAGEILARTGEPIRMGGGHSGAIALPGMPLDACPGPYWIVSELETMAAQAIPDIYVQPIGGPDDTMRGLFYAQSAPAPADGFISGELTLDDDGCLRLDGYTLLWPPHVWPDEDSDPLQIIYRDGDEEGFIAAVGEEVRFGGSERAPHDYRFFENKVNCAGPYWGMTAVSPAE